MYEVSVQHHFDAAHYLRGYQGKCERVHGHRFQVAVNVRAEEIDNIGLAYDFAKLKRHLEEVLNRFDHILLNEIPPFDKLNPSSENIATTIYQEFQTRLAQEAVSILSIQVCESPGCCVTYLP
jgi:6-pyruvoyltetrahydropterin/6-carboxytetrahydropterin synthase